MKDKIFVVYVLMVFLVTACSSSPNNLANSASQPDQVSQSSSSSPSHAEAFQAQASSAVSVELSWAPVEGAEYYIVELSFGGEYFPVAILDAGITSFEDFPVPDNTELSYRLLARSGADLLEEYELSLTTPVLQPNPMTLEIMEFMPVSPLDNFQVPTIDPNNPSFDPNAYVIPGYNLETGEFDIDAIMGEPVAVSADIGPEGGTLTVTAPDNITYTLFIPPGALEDITTLTMTPIESIEGLALDNLLGAVRLDPASLFLDVPVFLSYTLPEELVISDELVTMNFAQDPANNEFYFVPYFEGDPSSLAGTKGAGKLASPAFRNFEAPPLSGIAVQQFGPKGVGQGSPEKVRNTIKNRPPSNIIAQKSNQAAGAQMEDDLAPLLPIEELAPLIPVDILKTGHSLEVKVNSAQTGKQLAAAISEFETYFYLHGDNALMKDITNRIWDQIIDKTKRVFDENKKICLTENSFVAQAIGRKLQSPNGKFWKNFAEKFKSKYGDQLIKDIGNLIKNCKFQITLVSDITYKLGVGGDLMKTNAKVKTGFSLIIKLDPLGEPVLAGKGNIAYQGQVTLTSDACSPKTTNLDISKLPQSTYEIYAIRLQWAENGELKDLWLDVYSMTGKHNKIEMRCINKDGDLVYGGGQAASGQSGDFWGGLFAMAHFPNEQLIRNWKLSPALAPTVSSSGLLAEKVYQKINENSYFGGEVDENTTFQIEKLAGAP